MTMTEADPELIVRDARAWRRWLKSNYDKAAAVRLVLAKGGTTQPTRLNYADALEEALCYGWIDGQGRSRDDGTFSIRFTRRRRRSQWSQRNRLIAERLLDEGRMHSAGVAEIERAKADGRWEAAYPGQATIAVPDDLVKALESQPEAKAMFNKLSSQNRFAILYRVHQAKRAETRARRIKHFVAMLARGETVYAQRDVLSPKDPRSRSAQDSRVSRTSHLGTVSSRSRDVGKPRPPRLE
jgi:uncharacterized protein YdeI (YjbR/CyaY-like superfamily)